MEQKPISDNHHREERRTSKGRQKIEIKKIENENSRYVCFSKRKNGIFKKATEISTLCGAQIAVIIISEHGKIFTYGEPDVDTVVDGYLGTPPPAAAVNQYHQFSSSSQFDQIGYTKSQIKAMHQQQHSRAVAVREELKRELQMEEKKQNLLSNYGGVGGGFWFESDIEKVDGEDLEFYKQSLIELKKNVMDRIEIGSKVFSNSGVSDDDELGIIDQYINDNQNNDNDDASLYGSGLTSFDGSGLEFLDALINNGGGGGSFYD